MPWAAAIPAVAAIGGALISSNQQGAAANAQERSTNAANDLQKYQYDTTRADNMPALDARNASLSRLQELLGIGGNSSASGYGSLGGSVSVGDVTAEPGYQFGMQQGKSALQNQLTARGMRNSGEALKAGTQYANDYATTKYGDAYNRVLSNRNQQLNSLQSLAGLGQTGSNAIGQAGSNYANAVGGNTTALGNAQAANALAQGGTWGNALNQIGGIYQNSAGKSYAGGGTTMSGNSGYLDPNDSAWSSYTGG